MTTRVNLLAVLLLVSVSAGWGAPAYEAPVISVPLVSKGPVMDGKVDPAQWAQAAVLSDFVVGGGQKLPTLHTTVYVEYDATNFYLAAVCSDPNAANLKTAAEKRDGPVLADDCVQVAIDTVGQRKDVALLAVNAANVQYDAWNGDVSQSFKWESATSRGPDGWSLEMAVPFARGIGPAVGDSWLINVGRNAPGAGELSSWAPVDKSLEEKDRLGPLTFSGPPFRVKLRSLGELWVGKDLAQVEVGSWKSGPPLGAKLNARVDGGGRSETAMEKITVGAEPSVIGMSYHVAADGHSAVTFALTVPGREGKAVVVWRSAAYPIDVPAVTAALETLEKTLSETSEAWARMPAGAPKDALQASLGEVLTGWQNLAHRVAQRQSLSPADYSGLLTEAQSLNSTAQALQGQATGG